LFFGGKKGIIQTKSTKRHFFKKGGGLMYPYKKFLCPIETSEKLKELKQLLRKPQAKIIVELIEKKHKEVEGVKSGAIMGGLISHRIRGYKVSKKLLCPFETRKKLTELSRLLRKPQARIIIELIEKEYNTNIEKYKRQYTYKLLTGKEAIGIDL
jgi:predicted DNA-binding protein